MTGKLGRQRVIALVVTWIVAIVLILTRTLDAPHALVLAACASGLTILWPDQPSDIPALNTPPYRTHAGAHRDLSDLSWTLIDLDGRVSDRAMARVRVLADGTPLAQTIDSQGRVSPAQVLKWLDIIDSAQGEQ